MHVVCDFVAGGERGGGGGGQGFVVGEVWIEVEEGVVVLEGGEGVGEGCVGWEGGGVVEGCGC